MKNTIVHLPGPLVAGAGEGLVIPSSATDVLDLAGELLGKAAEVDGVFGGLFTLLCCC